ncbi:MAG: response regulator [Armatimonadetes bacterium]|nr:response regulator [Armatimonadota bacterium]
MPRETVLVVDDDEATRQACRAALETARFRVAEAADLPAAARAIDHLKAASTACDLALVDYLMPEQNGFNVFHHLRRAQPDLAGILLTGHTSLNVAVEALNRSFSQVIPKPIEPRNLLEAVEAALAERRTVLENARLRALTRLYDALDRLASVTAIDGLYQCIVRLAVEEISADSASLMLLDERRMHLYVASAHGHAPPPVGGGKHFYGEPICGWVLRHGVALELAPGKPLPAAVRAAMHRPEVSAAVCLPLCPGGRPLGVLNINRYGGGGGFLPGDLEVATVLASDAALTIQRLVLLEERRRRERAATVGRLASTIIHDRRPRRRWTGSSSGWANWTACASSS